MNPWSGGGKVEKFNLVDECRQRGVEPVVLSRGDDLLQLARNEKGMNDEMSYIVVHALADYPAWQAGAALRAMGQQLLHVATGEGTNGWIPHTYGIIERYIPEQVAAMRAARQQHWAIDFTAINWIHVPVALASLLAVFAMVGRAAWRRRLDDLTLLAATVSLAMNLKTRALICSLCKW